MKSAPRILFISPYSPNQASGGAELRSLHVFRALQHIGEVHVAAIKDHDTGGGPINPYGNESDAVRTYTVNPLPRKKLADKFKWMVNPRSDYPHGCALDNEVAMTVFQRAKQADLVWFYKLRTANMFPTSGWSHSVMDVDDISSCVERATLRECDAITDRLFTAARMLSWKRRERLAGDRFTVLSVCSQLDKDYLHSLGVTAPVHVIPNGFAPLREEPVRKIASPPRIGFSGIFDYAPNADGVRWFVEKCWPRIKEQLPDARLRIAGRYSDGPLRVTGHDVETLGWVEDLDAEIATWSMMAVPIFIGGGTRLKIALGFSRKCPIVSTIIGAHGYEVNSGDELLQADTPEIFAEACLKLIRQPQEGAAMAERAYTKFLQKWTWEAIQPRIWSAAEDCLRRSAATSIPKTAEHSSQLSITKASA
jgi:glycosyltransferase involved in cell wall biosynthesis